MNAVSFVVMLCLVAAVMVLAEDASSSQTSVQPTMGIPEGYEIGEKSISTNGRFAILYPIHKENDNGQLLPNLLVCLKPYALLSQIGTEGGRWQGARDEPLAKWNGNSMVAIW